MLQTTKIKDLKKIRSRDGYQSPMKWKYGDKKDVNKVTDYVW